MSKSRAAVVLAAAAIVVVTSASCLDPTEITLAATTDAPCAGTKGAAFAGGATSNVETAQPNTTTTHCEGGSIGTLVATPTGIKDAEAWFVVTLGVDRPVHECTAANQFKGCIVQRRSLRYVKHKPINLPINMWLVCKDVACDKDSTCARNGKCVPAKIADAESCANGPCYPTGDGPGDFPGADAGPDGNDAEGGTIDDGSTINDASSDRDSSFVVPPPPPAGRLYCPPEANGCDKGTTCCWRRDTGGGTCAPASCTPGEIPLRCNRASDCAQPNGYCCGRTMVSMGMGFAIRLPPHPPPGPLATDSGTVPDRSLVDTDCVVLPNPCTTFICGASLDCPSTFPVCDKNTGLFKPPGIFGECVLM